MAGSRPDRSPAPRPMATPCSWPSTPIWWSTQTFIPTSPTIRFRDFTPISIIAKVYLVLVASSKIEATSVQELLAFARAHPGKLNYASIGLGTQAHLGMELLKIMTKTDITQVSYRG